MGTSRAPAVFSLAISMICLAYICRLWYQQDPSFASMVDRGWAWARWQGSTWRQRTQYRPGWWHEMRQVRGLE